MEKAMRKKSSAFEYLQKHKIIQLFENIIANAVFERPGNFKIFMCNYLQKLIKAKEKDADYPCLFDTVDLRNLFSMLDTSGSGVVTFNQYKSVLKAVGAKTASGQSPELFADEISAEIFISDIKDGLARASVTCTTVRPEVGDF